MPLISGKSSTERRQAFETGLLHLVRLGRVAPGLTVNPYSQPIWHLNVNHVAGDFHLPTAARLVGWRYLAGSAPGEVVAGDVSATSPPTVTNLAYGDKAKTLMQAFLALEGLPEVNAGNFETRVLRIPGALVEGFWLKPPTDENGLLVPCGRMFGEAPLSGKPCPIDDFLKNRLRPVIEHVSAGQAASSGSETP
ncbi:MAG: hypothetical protein JWP08_3788 [Bryobacterales bacterium]|nr:hypothetical protein [Bryobacterales bacterium]